MRHHLRDRTGAAVEVHHQFLPCQTGELHRLGVKHLRLIVIHLIERRHGQAECQTAQGVLQVILPPKRAVGVTQNRVAPPGIAAQHNPHCLRQGLAQHRHPFLFMGQPVAVDQQADKGLSFTVGAHIEMAQQAFSGGFLIAGNVIAADISPQGVGRCIGRFLLNKTFVNGNYLMGACPVKAHRSLRRHRINRLIAIAQPVLRAQNFLHTHLAAADACQCILYAPALGIELLLVAHVAEVAAAAPAVVGAVRLTALRRRCVDRRYLAEGRMLEHLHHKDVAILTAHGTVHEHHLSVNAGNAQPLGGVALNDGAVGLVLLQGHA